MFLTNLLDLRNLLEQVRIAFCYRKLFWHFTVWINCSSDFKKFKNYQPSASNFKSFSRSLEQSFLTVGQNNFGNKIPFLSLPSQHPPTCGDKCCIFINVQVTLFNATVKLILLIWVFDPCSSLGGLDNYKVQTGAMVYSGLWAVQFPLKTFVIFTLLM
jgi:hypothetical protein